MVTAVSVLNNQPADLAKVEDILDQIAEWPIAVYGGRISSISLALESSCAYWDIRARVKRADGESYETLPNGEVEAYAEAALLSAFPAADFENVSSGIPATSRRCGRGRWRRRRSPLIAG